MNLRWCKEWRNNMSDKVDILIVDDIIENHFVMESVLEDEELNIVRALSGEEALALCLVHNFAVVFMDVQMPFMDGFETAELLRGIEKTKYIPIIFVTALNKDEKSIFRGYEVGAVDYLPKPIDPLVLRSKARIFKEMHVQRLLIESKTLELEAKVKELLSLQEEKDRLENISIEDDLTKIYNRRGIDRMFSMHWKNCIRYQLPIAAIMFDIDYFKRYNDNYGHLKGDKVLYNVAKTIKETIYRAEDFVGRYGGEEFLVVMPNTRLESGIKVAKRIQSAINEMGIVHEYNNNIGIITVSIGVAMSEPEQIGVSIEDLINQADKAMYEAKNNGRNQICPM